MLSAKRFTSYGVLAIKPIISNDREIRKTPLAETDPWAGLMAYRPALLAGYTSEPLVSVPRDRGAKPAETPTADPEEGPLHGMAIISTLNSKEHGECNWQRSILVFVPPHLVGDLSRMRTSSAPQQQTIPASYSLLLRLSVS